MNTDNTAYGNELTLILKLNNIYNMILTVNHNNKQLTQAIQIKFNY